MVWWCCGGRGRRVVACSSIEVADHPWRQATDAKLRLCLPWLLLLLLCRCSGLFASLPYRHRWEPKQWHEIYIVDQFLVTTGSEHIYNHGLAYRMFCGGGSACGSCLIRKEEDDELVWAWACWVCWSHCTCCCCLLAAAFCLSASCTKEEHINTSFLNAMPQYLAAYFLL